MTVGPDCWSSWAQCMAKRGDVPTTCEGFRSQRQRAAEPSACHCKTRSCVLCSGGCQRTRGGTRRSSWHWSRHWQPWSSLPLSLARRFTPSPPEASAQRRSADPVATRLRRRRRGCSAHGKRAVLRRCFVFAPRTRTMPQRAYAFGAPSTARSCMHVRRGIASDWRSERTCCASAPLILPGTRAG